MSATAGFLGRWYPIYFSSLLAEDDIYHVSLFGKPLVVFRGEGGRAVCIQDRCPHRTSPLHSGRVVNGEIECPYHGALIGIDPAGDHPARVSCSFIVDERYARKARTMAAWSYETVEQDGYIWIWFDQMNARRLVEAPPGSRPPETFAGTTPSPRVVDTVIDLAASHERVVENNMDPLHLFFVHSGWTLPNVTRKTMKKLATSFEVVDKDQNVGRCLYGWADGDPLLRITLIDKTRVLLQNPTGSYSQILDHIPQSHGATRILIRQVFSLGSAGRYLPRAFDYVVRSRTYRIFSQDADIMEGQGHLEESYGAKVNHAPLAEDQMILYYNQCLDQAREAGDPWEGANGSAHAGVKFQYPPVVKRDMYRSRAVWGGTVLSGLGVVGLGVVGLVRWLGGA